LNKNKEKSVQKSFSAVVSYDEINTLKILFIQNAQENPKMRFGSNIAKDWYDND